MEYKIYMKIQTVWEISKIKVFSVSRIFKAALTLLAGVIHRELNCKLLV